MKFSVIKIARINDEGARLPRFVELIRWGGRVLSRLKSCLRAAPWRNRVAGGSPAEILVAD
jgi:hypothetical protein